MPSSGFQTCALRSEEHTSELQSHDNVVCRLLLEKNQARSREDPRGGGVRGVRGGQGEGGVEVFAAAKDGEEAVELARSEAPDLAIFFFKIPGPHGIQPSSPTSAFPQ